MPMTSQKRQDLRVKDLLTMSFRHVGEEEFKILSIMSIEQNTKCVWESIKSDDNRTIYVDGELTQVQQKLQIIESKINQLLGVKGDSQGLRRTVTDISATGIRFESEDDIPEDSPIEIEIILPHNLMMPIKLIAKTIRSDSNHIAAKFYFRGAEEEDIITKYVFMKNRKEVQIKKRLENK